MSAEILIVDDNADGGDGDGCLVMVMVTVVIMMTMMMMATAMTMAMTMTLAMTMAMAMTMTVAMTMTKADATTSATLGCATAAAEYGATHEQRGGRCHCELRR